MAIFNSYVKLPEGTACLPILLVESHLLLDYNNPNVCWLNQKMKPDEVLMFAG